MFSALTLHAVPHHPVSRSVFVLTETLVRSPRETSNSITKNHINWIEVSQKSFIYSEHEITDHKAHAVNRCHDSTS